MTLRGQAKLLSGSLDEADADLRDAARLQPEPSALPSARRWRCSGDAEVALYRGHARAAESLLDEALRMRSRVPMPDGARAPCSPAYLKVAGQWTSLSTTQAGILRACGLTPLPRITTLDPA